MRRRKWVILLCILAAAAVVWWGQPVFGPRPGHHNPRRDGLRLLALALRHYILENQIPPRSIDELAGTDYLTAEARKRYFVGPDGRDRYVYIYYGEQWDEACRRNAILAYEDLAGEQDSQGRWVAYVDGHCSYLPAPSDQQELNEAKAILAGEPPRATQPVAASHPE